MELTDSEKSTNNSVTPPDFYTYSFDDSVDYQNLWIIRICGSNNIENRKKHLNSK